MESESPYRLTIAALLSAIAGIAVILSLGSRWSEGGGLWLALPVAILPFCVMLDWATLRSWRPVLPSWRQALVRLACVLVLSIAPAITAWLGLRYQCFWWSPCPYLVFLPAAHLGPYLYEAIVSQYVIYSFGSVAFVVLVFPVLTNVTINRLPIRSIVLITTSIGTSAYWFSSSFAEAFDHQSAMYIYCSIVANVLIAGCLSAYWAWFRLRFNVTRVLFWNVILCSWLFWLAFPWLGEPI